MTSVLRVKPLTCQKSPRHNVNSLKSDSRPQTQMRARPSAYDRPDAAVWAARTSPRQQVGRNAIGGCLPSGMSLISRFKVILASDEMLVSPNLRRTFRPPGYSFPPRFFPALARCGLLTHSSVLSVLVGDCWIDDRDNYKPVNQRLAHEAAGPRCIS